MSRPSSHETSAASTPAGDGIPRPKRIACVVCRKRKLRCDGGKPSCGTCARLGHNCAYDEIRRKSGPKRGYVKLLEARLAQVETMLRDQGSGSGDQQALGGNLSFPGTQLVDPPIFPTPSPSEHVPSKDDDGIPMLGGPGTGMYALGGTPGQRYNPSAPGMVHMSMGIPFLGDPQNTPLDWNIIAMGLDEALPAQDIVDALHRTYFDKIHPNVPIIHRGRYMAALDLAPNMRPPVALRYAIWTLAASVSDEFANLQSHFYRSARKYLEDGELSGHGENIINIAASQAWSLIACYEFKLMYFPRAWMSTGRAVRLVQMMGMHRLDGAGVDVKQCLPPPKDWTEKEERRRTFWVAFCVDRYASIGTGWPMTIDEKDVLTNLPSTDDAFDLGRPSRGLSLKEAMTAEGASRLSPYGGICLMACLFGRNLIHLHRPDADDRDDDLNGEFWRRHRNMDNVLLNIALSLPPHFRLPSGINDPNIVFTNMNIHASTICLHQAAIFKAEKNRMPATVSAESKVRCITAAAEIASIMRMVCHIDLSGMNPFISFCLYVAARVFVQYLKTRPGDEQVRSSLQFLLTAMTHLKDKNPLTESFLVQLDVDLTGSLDAPVNNSKFPYGLKKGQAELFIGRKDGCYTPSTPEATFSGETNKQHHPDAPDDLASDLQNIRPVCGCMPYEVRQILERHARTTPPTANLSKFLGGLAPAICVCMSHDVRNFLEACSREAGLTAGFVALCSHQNSDTGGSPAGLSDISQMTTSRTSNPASSSAASYSPLNLSDFGGMDMSGGSGGGGGGGDGGNGCGSGTGGGGRGGGAGGGYQMQKDMNWEMLGLEAGFDDAFLVRPGVRSEEEWKFQTNSSFAEAKRENLGFEYFVDSAA